MKRLLLISIIFFSLFHIIHGATVLGIDFGSDTFKMSLIKGNSFEVVINKESSRKTLNAVGFTKSMQRAFGMRASSLQVRNDDRVFKFAANLLGKQFGNPIVDSKKNFYPYKLVKDEERETYGISITNGTQEVIFTPEEIIGMILEHGKEAAEAFSESSVKDCVITVPPYWTHHERKALIQAAKFAGLNVLTVINELTAVAVKYSISRKFEGTENVLFYDLGESTTKVIVVSFSKFVDEKNKTVPQMQVLSSKWDTSIGVRDLENSLVQHFADLINQDKASHKYTGGDIRKHKGAMGKLAKETRRTKEVLSANTETIVSVDGIIGEYDFRAQITRETFEKINENNWGKLVEIARSALKDADVDVKDLSAFELVGGGIRIPRVYESLRQFYGRESLDRHLNGDESACQGAAYYGVTKSIVFKTQSIQVRDINPYPVSLTILDDTMENNKKVFFRDNSKFDDKKTLSFRSFNDTQIRFDYEPHKNIPEYSPLPLAIFNITGMPTSQEYNFTTTPKITATIVYKNGVVSIEKADVRFRYATTQKITKKIKKEEKAKKEDESAEPVTDDATDADDDKDTKKETTKDTKDSKTKKEEKPYEEVVVFEPVNKTKTVNLVVTGSSLGIPDFSPERLKEITQRYNRLNKIESNRIKRQKALNDLESFILNNRDALEEKGFVDASTSTERDNIKQIFDNNLEWLEDEGSSASLKELEKRIKEVKREVERVNYRISESTAFPLAVKNCRATCNFTRLVLENITQTHEVTDTEYEIAIKDLGELEEYLNEKEKEQSEVPLYEDPKISSSSVNSKCNVFTSLTKRLLTRKRRVPKKETKIETANNSTESTSESASSEKAQTKKDDDNSDDDPTNEKEETPEKEEEIL